MTPADELRAAACKLRDLVSHTTGNLGAWEYAKGSPQDSVRTAAGWEITFGDDHGSLRFIAAMHPGVGAALADWLDSAAIDAEQIGPAPHALAVARAINGTTEPDSKEA